MLDSFKLDGKVALVTGAGQGLGQGMALALAEAGADIVGLDRRECGETCAAVKAMGRRFKQVVCDLRQADAAALQEIVAGAVTDMGHLDILLNNAGIIRRAPALQFTEADWDDVLHINLRVVFFLSQAAAGVMVPQGHGKIIQIASMLSFQGGVIVPAYTAAKSGVAGITRALANEWAPLGLNVNAIAPGYMATDNTAPLRADAGRSTSILGRIPANRWGTPNDLQGVVVFLASSASDYLNGAIIPVDGGWLTR
ncbi:MAG: 2-dehydro-3-deoxy-D-gluconate 5-dehydrogenase KduD [Chloroflexi bacterium]|nr:2-dehydro-3-deoxy-D-gluconate 5-dehydrogenase KduD [Chloroflexota bacterium]